MNVRDALEGDADALASLADSPTDVMRNLVHDRTVRIAEADSHEHDTTVSGEKSQYGSESSESIMGFVSFDARENTVHVTQLTGDGDVCRRLLDEPVRFAERESMAVELLVAAGAEEIKTAVAEAGFRRRGNGPRFEDGQTERYRLEP